MLLQAIRKGTSHLTEDYGIIYLPVLSSWFDSENSHQYSQAWGLLYRNRQFFEWQSIPGTVILDFIIFWDRCNAGATEL